MNQEPLLSVAITMFYPDFIEDLFNTLKKQTYKNVEYICSIDSPDNPIIERAVNNFQNSVANVKVYKHRPKLGNLKNIDFVVGKFLAALSLIITGLLISLIFSYF